MPFQRDRYPKDWNAISRRVRERDGWRCQWCGALHGQPHPRTGSRVVLTVAHLGAPYPDGRPGDKRDKSDCRDENLAALCQACHLAFDRDEHVQSAAATRRSQRIAAGQLELNFGT